MKNIKSLSVLLVVVAITLILTTMPMLSDSAFAVKKSSSIKGSHSSTKTSSKSKTTEAVTNIKGVKVLRVHTVPSKVAVGNTFNLRGTVVNNSTATITFANGTCTSPLSTTFNKNAITEPQINKASSCRSQIVTLKPGQQSPILSPNLSGTIYRATAPGITNATLIFKFGAVPPTSKSSLSESYTRVYTFNILPPGVATQPSSSHLSNTTSSQHGVLKTPP